MVLMCQRLLPQAKRDTIYMQGSASFKLSKRHVPVRVYCSPHNPGAKDLAHEMNAMWPGLLQIVEELASWDDFRSCDHMLVYLNALTWTHSVESLAAEIAEAMHLELHLQPCHEFPSVLDPGSWRHSLEFKEVMDATPARLKKWPTNIYSQIAIALKGGTLRDVGLGILAGRLAQRVSKDSSRTTGSLSKRLAGGATARMRQKWSRTVQLGMLRPVSCGESVGRNTTDDAFAPTVQSCV